MPLPFFQQYPATRVDGYLPPAEEGTLDDPPPPDVEYDLEVPPEAWAPVVPEPPAGGLDAWPRRPRLFVDGKDVGETIAFITAPGGFPVPIRLGQIGAVVMALDGRALHRTFEVHEKVVSFVADPFPWEHVEAFARDLQALGFRFLPARAPDGGCTLDFERMRKAAQNRSNDEMGSLEEAALVRDLTTPTVIDGRLEPRAAGFDAASSPVYGVVKTQRKRYLHDEGLHVLFALEQGQRTPLLAIPGTGSSGLDVVSWYLRLAGEASPMLQAGIVRVEVARRFFEAEGLHGTPAGSAFADALSCWLVRLRHRDARYARAAISLHPIVRAEDSLGACFCDGARLISHFRHIAL